MMTQEEIVGTPAETVISIKRLTPSDANRLRTLGFTIFSEYAVIPQGLTLVEDTGGTINIVDQSEETVARLRTISEDLYRVTFISTEHVQAARAAKFTPKSKMKPQ